MSERFESSNGANSHIERHNAWFDALTLNPFEKELATPQAAKFLNPFEGAAKGSDKETGVVDISPLELEDYGLKREWYKDETGSGYATEYPFGLTVVRYEAGNFMLRIPEGLRHTENNDGLTTVYNSKGKKIATFESDGTLNVRTKDGTFSETPDGDVSLKAKPGKTGKKTQVPAESEKSKQLLPTLTIDHGPPTAEHAKKSDCADASTRTKPEEKEKPKANTPKKVPFDPLEGLDLDNLGY